MTQPRRELAVTCYVRPETVLEIQPSPDGRPEYMISFRRRPDWPVEWGWVPTADLAPLLFGGAPPASEVEE